LKTEHREHNDKSRRTPGTDATTVLCFFNMSSFFHYFQLLGFSESIRFDPKLEFLDETADATVLFFTMKRFFQI
jgi:hypothetical protein